MITRISLILLAVLSFAGFRFIDNQFLHSTRVEMQTTSKNTLLAVRIPNYCANNFGVTAENATEETLRLNRKFKRSCSNNFPERPLARCVNRLFKTKDGDCDGIKNRRDNCANTPNSTQVDTDLDGTGDVCEAVVGSLVL